MRRRRAAGWLGLAPAMLLAACTDPVEQPRASSHGSEVPALESDVPDTSADSAAEPVKLSQQTYIKAPNAESGDELGGSVAIDGDIMVVGAPGEASAARSINGDLTNNSALGAGAVYVYRRTADGWAQDAYIKASNAGERDFFGSRVAISGTTLVVSAVGEASATGDPNNNEAPASGAVYVFRRGPQGWAQEAYLKASNASIGDLFGAGLAIHGDTLVVGAPGEASATNDPSNDDAPASGALYVFRKGPQGWSQQAYLKAQTVVQYQQLGASVAVEGDTLVAGAPGESVKIPGAEPGRDMLPAVGAVYVFRRTAQGWAPAAQLRADDAAAAALFGSSVAISGSSLAVGAPGESTRAPGTPPPPQPPAGQPAIEGAPASGAVYMFRRSGQSWAQEAFIKASNAGMYDQFGTDVALSGNALAVSAPGEASGAASADPNDNSMPGSGAVYLFNRTGQGWSESRRLKASNAGSFDFFGASIALSPQGKLAVGAPGEAAAVSGATVNPSDDTAQSSGAAYIFE